MSPISVAQRRKLSAQGHGLNPVVLIGRSGLTENVLNELDRALLSHELLKVKVQLDDRNTRKTILEEICQKLKAVPVQHIGKIFIIYRPRPEEILKQKPAKHQKHNPTRHTKRSFQN